MTHQGAVLQGYNNELVKYLEDLSVRREELDTEIRQAEQEKKVVQDEIAKLTAQLGQVCESLAWKNAAQRELDKILAETEVAYEKILQSSRILLNVLKTEMGNLDKVIALKNNVPMDG
ncbi:microtubule nucleation factor SSNA1-like [Heteronotia binoei]|uniref:microtubule nucleation factor SSNA1-like n=1 Tax=Heteronotia binoei TaxID=13085 RepID=UPI00292D07DC|nr:microtubule nucleation factor SSNA1-like [Heteronotia binoei]